MPKRSFLTSPLGMMLDILGGSGTPVIPVVYLLEDNFTTDDAAPITSPRTCEPGPGTLTIVDTANRLSISGEKLVISPSTTAFTMVSAGITRAAGLAFSMEVQRPPSSGNSAPVRFGITDGAGDNRKASFLIAPIAGNDGIYAAGSLITPIVDFTTIERYIVIERAAGSFMIISVGGHDYLHWIDAQSNEASPQAAFVSANSFAATGTHTADKLLATQLDAPFTTTLGLALASNASPSTGATLTGAADGTVEITWPPGAGEVLTIEVRRTDDDNLFKLVCDQAANTLKLYTRVGGTDTELDPGKTQTWTAGTPRRIVMHFHDNVIRTVVANVLKHNTTSSTNLAGTGVKVSGFATATNLIAWPWELDNLPAPFNSYTHVAYVSYGDSKTASGTWQATLSAAITNTTRTWFNTTVAHSAQTVSTMHDTYLTDDMAGLKVDASHILCNLGANDVQSALPAEATWKAKYLAIFDAMHAKCPDALIYVAKAWARGQATRCNTLATWIDDLIPQRSFLRAGHDERTWLENGDDGATYTTDGIHYTAAGNTACAAQWQSILGF